MLAAQQLHDGSGVLCAVLLVVAIVCLALGVLGLIRRGTRGADPVVALVLGAVLTVVYLTAC